MYVQVFLARAFASAPTLGVSSPTFFISFLFFSLFKIFLLNFSFTWQTMHTASALWYIRSASFHENDRGHRMAMRWNEWREVQNSSFVFFVFLSSYRRYDIPIEITIIGLAARFSLESPSFYHLFAFAVSFSSSFPLWNSVQLSQDPEVRSSASTTIFSLFTFFSQDLFNFLSRGIACAGMTVYTGIARVELIKDERRSSRCLKEETNSCTYLPI